MTLLHELAGHVQETTETSARAATRGAASAQLALHVELESHLSSLRNGILLSSTGIL
jgi:hypothetical protein